MPTLLVVDDEPSILHAFRRVFEASDVTLLTGSRAREGIDLFRQQQPDVVILDVQLPDMSGLDALCQIRELDAKVPVIFITGHGTTETAIEATKLGAFDYLFKPLELDKLRELVAHALQISRQMRDPPVVADGDSVDTGSDVLVGRCEAMKDVYVAIGRVAPQDVTVLIQGESGTGKELVARAIYHHSRRCKGPFRAVNCAAIPETLLESELFGHEKGAFTGADRLRIGKFEQTDGGTLFLDEIADMTPMAQAKILRILQEGQFDRLGGNETLQADVRVIAATNCDLGKLVAEGSFRKDLYYRLGVFTITLPPLKQRGDDLRLLTEHFVARFGRELDKTVGEIAPGVHELLQAYSWPGNIRELQSVLKQALLCATGPVLVPEFLPSIVQGDQTAADAPEEVRETSWDRFIHRRLREGSENLYDEWTAMTERQLLSHVLDHTGGNISHAARILGISRRTLRTKLHSLGIYDP
jgi:two-component system nitrogen regulation response regulator GlnG